MAAHRLQPSEVRTLPEGKHYDKGGFGLYLRVTGSGRYWLQRLTIAGKRRDVNVGVFPFVSLAQARQQAFQNKAAALAGKDPKPRRVKQAGPAVPTFAEAAARVIEIQSAGWRDSGKSAKQWDASLRQHVFPKLDRMSVADITTADVLAALLPIWTSKRETARRIRQRVSVIMRWAIAEGHRTDNPAGDALTAVLPKGGASRKHHQALPYAKLGDAMAKVQASRAWVATKAAFELIVLTAARSGEVRLARWEEFDLEAGVWTVPGERMKAGREHRQPLSTRAVALLLEIRSLGLHDDLVFPSPTGKPMSDSTLSKLSRELDLGMVPHGARSSFRDWAGETGEARDAAEMQLAHVLPSVEGAYARSDLLERRRGVMEKWARYLED